MEDAIGFGVAAVAAGMARAFLEKNGLDVGFVEREIERGRCLS
jgi:hypothetical protein